jgi:hypothetical protein
VAHLAADGSAASVVEGSALGIERKDASFSGALSLFSASRPRSIDETYTMLVGKQREIRNRALEQTFTFANAAGDRVEITVRAMEDGFAFRYGFPKRPAGDLWVTGESTAFALPKDGAGCRWERPRRATPRGGPCRRCSTFATTGCS